MKLLRHRQKGHCMHSPDSATAKESLALWLFHAENSHIPEFDACITAVRSWSEYILNSFDVPYSNGFTEGCNSKTKVLKRVCFGVIDFPTFRNRSLHCAAWPAGKDNNRVGIILPIESLPEAVTDFSSFLQKL